MGAWIETENKAFGYAVSIVAPYVGAWIETKIGLNLAQSVWVAPYVGAWIETEPVLNIIDLPPSRTLRGCVD